VILVDVNGRVNARTPSLIKEAIRSVTAQPVRYFVYSHSTLVHSTGGAVFADTARFVGHKNAVAPIKAVGDPTTPAPDIVFDEKISPRTTTTSSFTTRRAGWPCSSPRPAA
jgi:hypothetical protein